MLWFLMGLPGNCYGKDYIKREVQASEFACADLLSKWLFCLLGKELEGVLFQKQNRCLFEGEGLDVCLYLDVFSLRVEACLKGWELILPAPALRMLISKQVYAECR